jgi:hypothetical protein
MENIMHKEQRPHSVSKQGKLNVQGTETTYREVSREKMLYKEQRLHSVNKQGKRNVQGIRNTYSLISRNLIEKPCRENVSAMKGGVLWSRM